MKSGKIIFNINEKLKEQFKKKCRKNGSNMTAELTRFILKYLGKL